MNVFYVENTRSNSNRGDTRYRNFYYSFKAISNVYRIPLSESNFAGNRDKRVAIITSLRPLNYRDRPRKRSRIASLNINLSSYLSPSSTSLN